MSWLSCFGRYNGLKFRCKWLCIGFLCKRERLLRELEELESDQEQQERFRQEGQVESRRAREEYRPRSTAYAGYVEAKVITPGAPEVPRRPGPGDVVFREAQRGNPMQVGNEANVRLPCYGSYDDSYACGYCSDQQSCFQLKHYPTSSSFSIAPTDSSAVDTGATQVEGGSNMNEEELEARKTKAKKLEVTPVGDDFMIKSSTSKGGYMVNPKEEGGYHCACMDYALHRKDPDWRCKHIIAVETYLESRGPMKSDSRFELLDLNED